MASLMTIQLNKGDSPNLGFRLQGGKDFGTPLVIQKVNGGSPAEKSGLVAGDSVIKINSTDVFNLRHKDAQDVIVRAGPAFTVTVQRGGSVWKPSIIPTGAVPQHAAPINNISNVTKTSLAAQPQRSIDAIGTGHNTNAKPFLNGTSNGGSKLVNKQYNSPVGLYSEQSIAETLSAQSEVLSTGALGVNFKKNEKEYDSSKSAVYHMLQEVDRDPRDQEPDQQDSGVITAPLGGLVGLRHVQAPDTKPAPPTPQLPPGQNICADCERLIVGVFVRIKEKNLHVECFKCSTCGASLKNVGYYNINNKLYCDVHAKLAARNNAPAPNLVPVTIPPGGRAPASAISAALSIHPLPSSGPRSPQAAPLSPNTNQTAAPFQALERFLPVNVPKAELDLNENIKEDINIEAKLLKSLTLAAAKKSSANTDIITTDNKLQTNDQFESIDNNKFRSGSNLYSQFIGKTGGNFNQSGARPFSSVNSPLSPSSNNYSRPLPRTPVQAPPALQPVSPAPSSTPEVRCVNIVWPPVHEESELPTASPLYFPPPSQIYVPPYIPKDPPEEQNKNTSIAYSDQTDRDYSELEEYNIILQTMDPKMSMCSSEVCNITDRRSAVECAGTISEHIGTQMLFESIIKQRPKSPPPLDVDVVPAKKPEPPRQEEKKTEGISSVCPCNKSCCNDKCDTCPLREPAELKRPGDFIKSAECAMKPKVQNTIPQNYETPMVQALSIASDRPYSPIPDPFAHLPQKRSTTAFASALSIAPSEPFHAVSSVFTSFEAVPLPPETVPYFPPEHPIIPAEPKPPKQEIEKPTTPFVDALKIAPDRPFTPVGVAATPVRKKKESDPYLKDLPKPQEHISMRAALTTAPDRCYTPVMTEVEQQQRQEELQREMCRQEEEQKEKEKQAEKKCLVFKQPNPQPFISSMVNTFEGSSENLENSSFPPVSMDMQHNYEYHADYEQVKSELSSQIIEQTQQKHFEQRQEMQQQRHTELSQMQQTQQCTRASMTQQDIQQIKEQAATIARQAEEIVLKKPLTLAQSLHKSEYIPQYQTSLEFDEEIQLPHHKNINKLLNPQNKQFTPRIIPDSRLLLRPEAQHTIQTPPPHITKPVTTVQPGTSPKPQVCFQIINDDFQTPNSAFSQRVASPRSSNINKPPSAIPYYQQNLIATEFLAPEINVFDPKSPAISRSPSPCLGAGPERSASPFVRASPRSKSPAAGPPPNPLKVNQNKVQFQQDMQVEKAKDSLSAFIPHHREKLEHIQTQEGNRYDDYKMMAEKSVTLSENIQPYIQQHNLQAQSYLAESAQKHERKQEGNVNISISEQAKMEQLQQLNKSQMQSIEKGDNGVQIQRKKTVTEEYEHTHKEKTIEIAKNTVSVPKHPFQKVNVPPIEEHGMAGLHFTNPQPIVSPFLGNKPQAPPPVIQRQQIPTVLARYEQPKQPYAQPAQTQSFLQPKPTPEYRPVQGPPPPVRSNIPVATGSSAQNVKPNVPVPSVGAGGGRQAGGSVFAPKRGRGVLNVGGMVGSRIPSCGACHQHIRGPFITALGKIWCPEHFTCATASCKRPLQDIGFVEERGQLHCEYCFEQYLAPNCSKCNIKIKGDCLKAIGKNFHPECFNCAYCGKLFANSPFFLEDGLPYCETDWNEMFTTKCFACGFPVEAGDRWVEALNNNYHSQCFNCSMCKKNLEGQSFFAKGGRPFCKTHAR